MKYIWLVIKNSGMDQDTQVMVAYSSAPMAYMAVSKFKGMLHSDEKPAFDDYGQISGVSFGVEAIEIDK